MRSSLVLAGVAFSLMVASAASADEPAPPPSPPAEAPSPSADAKVDTSAPAPTVSEGIIPPGAKYPGDGQRLVGAVVGAAGFLTIAIGGFLTISAMTIYDEAESRCSKGVCARSDVDDSKLARTRANIGGYVLLGGLALLGGGVALYFTATPRPKDKAPPQAKLGIAPTLGGLAAFGTF